MDTSWPHFQMEEGFDHDGVLRLALIGELDLAVTDALGKRLHELQVSGSPVRIDLTRLEFVDSTGLRELIRAVAAARQDGWQLEICGELTGAVSRVIDLVGVRSHIFPDGG